MRSPRNRSYGSMSDSSCSLGDPPSSSSSTNDASESNHDVTVGKGVSSFPPLPDSSCYGKSVGFGRWRFCSGCILYSCKSLPASACLSAPSLPSMDTCDGTEKNLCCLEGSLANSSIRTHWSAWDTLSETRLCRRLGPWVSSIAKHAMRRGSDTPVGAAFGMRNPRWTLRALKKRPCPSSMAEPSPPKGRGAPNCWRGQRENATHPRPHDYA